MLTTLTASFCRAQLPTLQELAIDTGQDFELKRSGKS
jgi:hypothetical protein